MVLLRAPLPMKRLLWGIFHRKGKKLPHQEKTRTVHRRIPLFWLGRAALLKDTLAT
uniref:Uncharacterized protein n=1 Tax=Arundo donax TaxID=35708 RepID=A0A0A9G235_ARUDO